MGTLSEVESYILDRGLDVVVGVDEAGRGNFAGPIVAGAALVPVDWKHPPQLTDSKDMTLKRRTSFYSNYTQEVLASYGIVVGTAEVDSEEIDKIGIDAAQARAQANAIRTLFHAVSEPPFVVVDGNLPPAIGPPEIRHYICVPKADLLFPAVSLASVFAKVRQTTLMEGFEKLFPGYGFGKHHGYGTKVHKAALKKLGPCAIHRKCYRPVAEAMAEREEDTAPREAWMMFDED